MSYTYKLQILEHHLDSFGHVNNAVYMQLFEQARWDFITENGYGSREIQERKIGPVILEANIKFRKELTNREFITINSTMIETQNPLIFSIHQEIVKENGTVSAIAEFSGGLMDLSKRKLIKQTPEWLAIFSD